MWCSEDLLIGALNACLMFTFLYQMGRRQLEVLDYESSAQGTLEHRDGKHRVTRITVQPRISLKYDHDMEAAREAINDTVDSCIISNSILASVQVDPRFDAPLKQPNKTEIKRQPLAYAFRAWDGWISVCLTNAITIDRSQPG